MEDNPKILIVDDRVENLMVLEKLLSKLDVNVIRAESGNEALKKTLDNNFALVLLDVQMPDMDGYETLELMRNNNKTKFLPVIFVSAMDTDESHLIKGIEKGAVDFIVKPVIPEILIGKVSVFLNLDWHRRQLELEVERRVEAENNIKDVLANMQRAMDGMIQAMSLIVEARDPFTSGHQDKVAEICVQIAEKMGLSEHQIEGIKTAAIIHDLGKIHIPPEILSKPCKIKDAEFDLIKSHPRIAYDILKIIEFPWPIADIIHQHHERLDGSGYPEGLTYEAILIEAKILSVADVVEAMTSHRPYRAALSIQDAIDEITKNKGTLYDSDVVEACLKVYN